MYYRSEDKRIQTPISPPPPAFIILQSRLAIEKTLVVVPPQKKKKENVFLAIGEVFRLDETETQTNICLPSKIILDGWPQAFGPEVLRLKSSSVVSFFFFFLFLFLYSRQIEKRNKQAKWQSCPVILDEVYLSLVFLFFRNDPKTNKRRKKQFLVARQVCTKGEIVYHFRQESNASNSNVNPK